MKCICNRCGKSFYNNPAAIAAGRGKFCSTKCYRAGQTTSVVCHFCGKQFSVRVSVLKKGSGKYCSSNCYSKWQSINKVGSKSPRWMGGRTSILKRFRNSSAYAAWRSLVFDRDRYRCIDCGATGYLESHHIIPVSKIVKGLGSVIKYNALRKCSLLLDVNNGITLCRNCHIKRHDHLKCRTK
jgi:hypothetical protein